MRQQRGFTLVELLVALGLASIIISLVMSFLIANVRSYKAINNETELQYQSQYILNFMTNKILEASSIECVRDNNNINLKDSQIEEQISEISFLRENNTKYSFKVSDDEIIYIDGSTNNVLGSNVEGMWISPISINASAPNFTTAKSIKIRLKLSKGNRSYEAKQTVYMRNNKK